MKKGVGMFEWGGEGRVDEKTCRSKHTRIQSLSRSVRRRDSLRVFNVCNEGGKADDAKEKKIIKIAVQH